MAKDEYEFNAKECTKDFMEESKHFKVDYDIWVYATENGDSEFLIRNIATEQDFPLNSKAEVYDMIKFLTVRVSDY